MSTATPVPTTEDNLTRGMPVEIGKIDRELKRLWEGAGGTSTRASLMNFAVYSECEKSLEKNTELLARLTIDHACRGIVIAASPSCKESNVQAWISAHCHVSGAGSKQVCSEQVSFLLEGKVSELMPNIVFAHLDSDLPLYFWWQGEFPEKLDNQLLDWVDRFLFDSSDWQNPQAQLKALLDAHSESAARLVLCDLNWTRLIHTRLALAQTFDHPCAAEFLKKVTHIRVAHAPKNRTAALLLIGCMTSQMGFTRDRKADKPGQWIFRSSNTTNELHITLEAVEGAPISLFEFSTGPSDQANAFVRLTREPAAEYLYVDTKLPNGEHWHQILPAAKDSLFHTVREELIRGGRHTLYLRSLEQVGDLL